MAARANDLTDMQFGRLRALTRQEDDRRGVFWLCSCECGNHHSVRADNLKGGRITSCGCVKAENLSKSRRITHGGSGTPMYKRWTRLKAICNSPTHSAYRFYGAKGIKVCDRWLNYEHFLADVGELRSGDNLVRDDKSKGYHPENVTIERGIDD